VAAAAYAGYAAVAWSLYGHVRRPSSPDEQDDLLDRFLPRYEAGGRHHVRIAAPAAITFAAARDMDLLQAPVVRALIRTRELILGATPDHRPRPRGLLAEAQALGWGILAEVRDREIVVGAATQPWKPNVAFRALPPDEFTAFCGRRSDRSRPRRNAARDRSLCDTADRRRRRKNVQRERRKGRTAGPMRAGDLEPAGCSPA
jgi:hypothetical protein